MQATHPDGDVHSFVFSGLPSDLDEEIVRQLNTQFMSYTDEPGSFRLVNGRLQFSFEDRSLMLSLNIRPIHQALMDVFGVREQLHYMCGRYSFTRFASTVHRRGWVDADMAAA